MAEEPGGTARPAQARRVDFTDAELRACALREAQMRRNVYNKKRERELREDLTEGERKEIQMMDALANRLWLELNMPRVCEALARVGISRKDAIGNFPTVIEGLVDELLTLRA